MTIAGMAVAKKVMKNHRQKLLPLAAIVLAVRKHEKMYSSASRTIKPHWMEFNLARVFSNVAIITASYYNEDSE